MMKYFIQGMIIAILIFIGLLLFINYKIKSHYNSFQYLGAIADNKSAQEALTDFANKQREFYRRTH